MAVKRADRGACWQRIRARAAFVGAEGRDHLVGGEGDDFLDGGSGDRDEASYLGSSSGVHVDLRLAGPQDTKAAGFDTLAGIEVLSGSPYADEMIGNAVKNILFGWEGNDTLAGGAGDDWLIGASGDDLLDGGDGDDQLDPGMGDDLLDGGDGQDFGGYFNDVLNPSGTGVRVDLGVAPQSTAGAGVDSLMSIERLAGSRYDDELIGDGGDNVLMGNEGGDDLRGKGGSDYLDGGSGIDALDGGDGQDTCRYGESVSFCEIFS